ncbi:TMEM165/GDT1 family protein [Candidatus Woesearchaeota archaeon]|nr:TMEM165/GDT1 family protein [Candidatus Woesearchaeota archaeon]
MTPDFLIPFVTITLAELGDKTMLAMIALSSRHKKAHFRLFLGSFFGVLLVDGLAILTGAYLLTFLPIKVIKIIAGLLFVGFGIYTLFFQKVENVKVHDGNAFLAAFSLMFMTELADKTQIAAALFATEYNPWLVLVSTVLGISLVTGLAIFIGKNINKYIKPKTVNIVSGIIFIVVGIASFLFSY